MSKKEGITKEHAGLFLVAIGFAVLVVSLSPSGITGFYVYEEGDITGDVFKNVVVGDVVEFTGVAAESNCGQSNCDGQFSGETLTIEATGVDSNCQCIVDDTNWNTRTITLNISQNSCNPSESCSPGTNGAVTVQGPGVTVASGQDPDIALGLLDS